MWWDTDYVPYFVSRKRRPAPCIQCLVKYKMTCTRGLHSKEEKTRAGEKKKKKKKNNIHFLVVASVLLLCVEHSSDFKVHHRWPLSSQRGQRQRQRRQTPNSIIGFSSFQPSWFKHKTTKWGCICSKGEMNIHAASVSVCQSTAHQNVSVINLISYNMIPLDRTLSLSWSFFLPQTEWSSSGKEAWLLLFSGTLFIILNL